MPQGIKDRIAAVKSRLTPNITEAGKPIKLRQVKFRKALNCAARAVSGLMGKEANPIRH